MKHYKHGITALTHPGYGTQTGALPGRQASLEDNPHRWRTMTRHLCGPRLALACMECPVTQLGHDSRSTHTVMTQLIQEASSHACGHPDFGLQDTRDAAQVHFMTNAACLELCVCTEGKCVCTPASCAPLTATPTCSTSGIIGECKRAHCMKQVLARKCISLWNVQAQCMESVHTHSHHTEARCHGHERQHVALELVMHSHVALGLVKQVGSALFSLRA